VICTWAYQVVVRRKDASNASGRARTLAGAKPESVEVYI
jgi:hypothetical protein